MFYGRRKPFLMAHLHARVQRVWITPAKREPKQECSKRAQSDNGQHGGDGSWSIMCDRCRALP